MEPPGGPWRKSADDKGPAPMREVGSWFVGSDRDCVDRVPDPCRESRREQAIARPERRNPFAHLSGASQLCWSIFDIYALCDALKGNRESKHGLNLTGKREFDTLEKFAQKCWRTQSSTKPASASSSGTPIRHRIGLDPRGIA